MLRLSMLIEVPVEFPPLALLRQIAPQPTIDDVAAATRNAWLSSSLVKRIKPGQRIAVGCGSRGIANYLTIAKATVDALKELGAKPFIAAAMGSHGGATPEGQRELLASYHIDEQHLGVEVRTDMTSRQIGINSWGEPVFWDVNALEADGVVTVSRVKPHTDFRGSIESGIVKMAVIGFGKREGASQHHRWGFRGLRDMIPETLKVLLDKTPLLGGLAVIENAQEKTALLEVVDRDDLMTVEPKLLEHARGLMGKLPFDALDVLIIGEIGKNYSGAGIDPNVVGRLLLEGAPELETNIPRVTRMVALDLSPESHGNGTGVGIADLSTDRLIASIDPIPFRMNNLTACFLRRSQLPFTFPTDRETIQCALDTCWQPIEKDLRFAVIPNTLEVAEIWASPPLVELAKNNPDLQIASELRPMPFDAAGNLRQEVMFPHSVRGRRRNDNH